MRRYFDSRCRIGPVPRKDPDASRYARERLFRENSEHRDRLFPVWSVLLPSCGDKPMKPDLRPGVLGESGVYAVQLHPLQHEYPLSPDFVGGFLEVFVRDKSLLIIDMNRIAPDLAGIYGSLDEIPSEYPGLPTLLAGAGWHRQRTVCLLTERHANLHIELSTYRIHRGVEEYVRRRWGPPAGQAVGSDPQTPRERTSTIPPSGESHCDSRCSRLRRIRRRASGTPVSCNPAARGTQHSLILH